EISVEIGPESWGLKVDGMRIEVDQTTGQKGLDQLLDAGIGDIREYPIGLPILRVGQHSGASPGHGRPRHGVAETPEQVAPGEHLTDCGLDIATLSAPHSLAQL